MDDAYVSVTPTFKSVPSYASETMFPLQLNVGTRLPKANCAIPYMKNADFQNPSGE